MATTRAVGIQALICAPEHGRRTRCKSCLIIISVSIATSDQARWAARGFQGGCSKTSSTAIAISAPYPAFQWVTADPNHLEMALLNLAVNARDAMPEGGFIVLAARAETIPSAEAGLKPGSYVCLSVIDGGEGMDEATLARAGEPFFTTKGIGKGTGLGLPMVHGFVEQTGGRLVLKSRKGKGTTA